MWEKVNLGDITKNLDNKRIPLNSKQRSEKTSQKIYPYIGANNILEYIDDYIFDEKILCIAEDGGSWGTQERCANIYNEKCWVNNHAHVLVENGKAHLEFLYYFLNNSNLNSHITGTTRGKLTRKALDSIKVPLPPIKDQIRIANILSRAEGLIDKRKESIQLLNELLKSTFLNMFGDPVRNEKGWEKFKFEDISTQITDGEHTTPIRIESGIKLLSARNIKNGYLDFDADLDYISEQEYIRICKRMKPEKNDILMSCSGSVGRVSVVNTNEPFSLVRSVALIKLKKDLLSPLYVQSFMQTPYFQNEIRKGSKTSSQSNIFTGAIKRLPIFVPPFKLQTQFVQIVEKTENIKTKCQESLQELENLYASLSQKAFKGELDLRKMEVEQERFDIAAEEGVGYGKK